MAGSLDGGLDARLRRAGRRFLTERPALEPLLRRARDAYARAYLGARTLRNRVRYAAPPKPGRLIAVDPHAVERVVELHQPMFREAGVVAGGDWDRPDRRFAEMDVYRAYERHFEDGVPWEETAFFDRILDEIETGREPWGCSTPAEFRERCARLDRLYDRIAEDGYYTQAELAGSDDDPIGIGGRLPTERLKNEIAIHVGRDGEALFVDGRNRLSIARLLDLDAVPVRVLRRHRRWQAIRDAYVRGVPAAERYAGHPDLAALTFGSG